MNAISQQKAGLWLIYSIGISDGVEETDGVTFRVEIGEPGKRGTTAGEDEWADMSWKACRVDLNKFRDKKVAVKFITDPGVTTKYDWACWGDIYIIEGELPKDFDGKIPAGAKILFDFQKLKPSRTGYIRDGEDITPIDSSATGATFEPATRTCGGVQKKGYFAHPGWKGEATGCPAFGEFTIDLSKPGQIIAAVPKSEKPKPEIKEEKGKAIVSYGFEPEEPEDWVLAFGAEVTNDPKNVISGKSSLFCDTLESDEEWHEFFHSDPANLPLSAKGTYTVYFKYRIIEKKGECKFYFLARSSTAGPGASDKGWMWIEDAPGKTGAVVSTFTLDDYNDYYLIIGTRFKGAIAIDDIKVFPGKLTEKELGVGVTGKDIAKAEKPQKVEIKEGVPVEEEEPEFEIKEGVVEPRVKEFKYLGRNSFSITFEWLVSEKIEEDYTIFIHFTNEEFGEKDREGICFQADHVPSSPTSSWKEKSIFIDGPLTVVVPEKFGTGIYYIKLGLYNEKERFSRIAGPTTGADKTVLGKIIITGTPGKIKDIRYERLKSVKQSITPTPPGANLFPPGNAPVFKISKPINIDADLSDWPQEILNAPLCIGEKKQLAIEEEEWKGTLDLGSTFYIAWDKDNFYLAEVRMDDILTFQDQKSRDFFQSDYLRVYFSKDARGNMPGKDDYLFAIIPKGAGDRPVVKLVSYDGYEHRDFNYSSIISASKLFENGWIMEIKIPFSSIGLTPQPGQTIGFQLVIGDSDKPGKRIHEMLWKPPPPNNMDYWFNPGTFGKLTFVENTFAWANLDRDLYLPGEAPRALIGVYTFKPGDDISGEIVLKNRQGDIIDKKSLLEKVQSPEKHIVLDMATLKSEGEYMLESSLKYQGQVFTYTSYAKAFAVKMRERKNLLALCQPSTPTIIPSVDDIKYTNSARQDGEKYIFEYRGEDGIISYEYIPGPALNITVLVNSVTLYKCEPVYTGPQIIVGKKSYPAAKIESKVLNTKFEKGRLSYECELACEGEKIKLTYGVSIQAKSLLVEVSSPQALFSSFKGPLVAIPAKQINIPYMNWIKVYYTNNYFISSYFDWTKTGCTWIEPGGPIANYLPKTDRTRNPLRESFYLVVSDDLLEVLPNLPNPKTPYMNVLQDRVMLDWWTGDKYTESAKYLETLKGYGVDKLAIIYHVWQRYGYDVKLPAHYPADPRMGGDEGMKVLGTTAKNLGYVFSLHENYIDYYPDYPEYTEEAVAIDQNGNRINAWYNPGTHIQSFRLKPTWIEKYARQESPKIHEAYQTTAAYLDVQPTGPPWQTDFDAREEGAASFKYVFDKLTWLYNFERETHGGPLFGEGNQHAFWAGRVDGCEAQIQGGQFCPVLVDFDLLKVHPLMVNHGMGYYSRWYTSGEPAYRGPKDGEIDKYRSQELAYGHAGFIDTAFHKNLTQVLREYYLTQPLMARYCAYLPEKILYMLGDKWVNSNMACMTDASRKVYVKYNSGLELWVNNEEDNWNIEGYTLPPFGFLGKGAGAISTTAKFGNATGDYSETPEWIFADPRTYETMYAETTLNIEPYLSEFTYLGERKFRIKYRWVVTGPVDKNYACFVHFTDENGEILFQNDHQLSRPTKKWEPGSTIEDGPYTIKIPENLDLKSCDIRIGLWEAPPGSGARAALKGNNDGQDRYIIGRIIVEQKDGAIVNLKASVSREGEGGFVAKNPPGTSVDFGTLVTNAAMRISKEKNALVVLPIPHGQTFNLTLRLNKITGDKPAKVSKITALDRDKKELGKVDFKESGGAITFSGTYPDAWYYRIE